MIWRRIGPWCFTLNLLVSFLIWNKKKSCSLFISSKTTSRGAVSLSVSLWRPGLICDTIVPVLPIFYFSSSWHYKKQLIVLSRSNSTCEYLFSHTCLLFSICFYWHSEAESFVVMWHWLWCAQWNRNLWIVLPCNFLSDIYDNWDPLKRNDWIIFSPLYSSISVWQ